uniref:Xin actin binding repeat containing 2a n=1 Tax=Labrus bergylta TaxID=56723 RepID=A0A3Q3F1U9_9LABR
MSATTCYDSSSTIKTAAASSAASASSAAYEITENFPPPPPNLLQEMSSQHQDQTFQQKHTVNKEQYFKHKSMAELKRLYKHIHPEVRKNIEADFLSHLTEAEKKDLENSGDVKTAKWLFETQQLDAIKAFSNDEDEEHKTKEEIEKGDVKTCKWLFETQPMDVLYEKEEKSEANVEEVQKGDVKTCTWLFETQTLDNIHDHTESESETILKTCTVNQEDIHGKDVRLARFLFETENLENLTGEDSSSFRRVTEIDVQSGDVSRMKYIFENRSSDIMSSTSDEMMQRLKTQQTEDIQKGNVVNCTWMFENQSIDEIRDEAREKLTVSDVQGGDVNKGRFIFETYSLDKIKEESNETDISKLTSIFRDQIERGDVKNYTMMFETQPLYAIRDKEGHYHEVTTVTKEEIVSGDVVGARWLFETKPLDSIRDSEEVYVIKAVTEEGKVRSKTVGDIQGGDVKTNKQWFETDQMSQKYIRTVSVSEIQKGDVRSATWMFETRTIDEIRGEGAEYDSMERVTKEEVMKGDVKQSVWLFEKQPLDSIKEMDGTELVVTKEEIPQADVKSTTWLFETTPFHEFNESRTEMKEIIGKSIKETLEELYCRKMVDSQGILIEADEIGDVRMAKFQLMNQEAPEIQKEEIIRGDLSNIMMNLLNRERGHINTTVNQLLNQERGINVEKEQIVRGDIQEAINNLLKNEGSSKRGILIQEDEKGDVRLTIYSLLNKGERASLEKEDVIQGTVSKTLHRLLSNSGEEESKKIRVKDAERGNVSFYSTCIESGALDYLKQLQYEPDETQERVERERIIGGDIEETKIMLRKKQQIGRTTKPSLKETNIPAAGVQNGPQEDSTEQEGNNLKENEKRPEETPAESEAPTAEEPVNVSHTQESGESNSSCEAVAQVGAEMESEVQPDVDEKDQSEEAEGMQERVEEVKVNGHDGRIESAADEKASQEERDKGNNDGMKNGEAVKVTLIDEEATAGQALNANSNNNNSNSQILLDREILFEGLTEDDEEKHQSLFLTDAAGATDFFNADLCEESKWMPNEVLQLAQRDDAFVPAGAKCVEATDSFFPDMNFFTETAGGALAFQAEAAEQKISTSSFLEDIFAGLSTSSSSSGLLSDFKSDIFGRSVTETTTPTVSALDDLLDFGMEARGSTEKDVMETSHSAGGDGTRSLWAEEDDDEALTVEEQIKRNRYYDDDESDDS